MSTALDEVYETVRDARAEGPDALAAMALSYGATMVLGVVRCRALRGQIVELRAAQTAADEMVATLRHERDAALAECKAARESAADTAEVWRLRESVTALRADRARAEAERGRAVQERDEARSIAAMRDRALTAAVQEREAFSLRLSAAERERDEARAALDLARESAREAREEIAQSLALVDDARAELDAALARPTYEARTVAPTLAERDVHQEAGGAWLVCRIDSDGKLHADVLIGWHGWRWEGYFFVALDARRLPCAWPEVSP